MFGQGLDSYLVVQLDVIQISEMLGRDRDTTWGSFKSFWF